MRGTQELFTDLVAVDGGDIVFDGSAHRQIVDMYNFWQQINAPEGQFYTTKQLVVNEGFTNQLKALQNAQAVNLNPLLDAGLALEIKELYAQAQDLGYIVDKCRGEILKLQYKKDLTEIINAKRVSN